MLAGRWPKKGQEMESTEKKTLGLDFGLLLRGKGLHEREQTIFFGFGGCFLLPFHFSKIYMSHIVRLLQWHGL